MRFGRIYKVMPALEIKLNLKKIHYSDKCNKDNMQIKFHLYASRLVGGVFVYFNLRLYWIILARLAIRR